MRVFSIRMSKETALPEPSIPEARLVRAVPPPPPAAVNILDEAVGEAFNMACHLGDLDEAAVEHCKGNRVECGHRRMLVFVSAGSAGVSYCWPSAIISGVPTSSLMPVKSSMRLRYGSLVPWVASEL